MNQMHPDKGVSNFFAKQFNGQVRDYCSDRRYNWPNKNEGTRAMRIRSALSFVLMCAVGFSGVAAAQTLDQQRCSTPDPDVSITGCTAMIQSGHETQENLAGDFYNRAVAYAIKRQTDRPIQDYDQAIRLNPSFVAFNNRGNAYAHEGQDDRAIQDFNQTIRLNPNYAAAFSNRGLAYAHKN